MLHATRALRRASEAAAARDALRRPLRSLTVAIAACAGVTLAVGAAGAPAVADHDGDIADVLQLPAGTEGVMSIADQTAGALAAAETAVADARALKREVMAPGLPVAVDVVAIDTGELQGAIDALGEDEAVPVLLLPAMTADAQEATHDVVERTAGLQVAFQAALDKKAADDAAKAAAEAAAALAASNTPDGAKATAREMAASQYGWGDDQFSCLESLWTKESGWNYQAYNPSGATGIPQALPGSKMASARADWQTNAATQIAWGLGYIASVYGAPCGAWSHSQAVNWY